MYPSLAAAAGLPPPATECRGCLEGHSATPLLDNPGLEWKKAAFSQYGRCARDASGYYQRCSGFDRTAIEVMGYSARTQKFRYTEWFRYNNSTLSPDMNYTVAVELYDHSNDRGDDFDGYDQINLAGNSSYADVLALHATIIREGWRAALPPS